MTIRFPCIGIPEGGDDQGEDIAEIYDDIIVGDKNVMEEIYDDVVSATTPMFSLATKSAEHEQPATFSDQGETSTANQPTWQNKTETSGYMTLVRRPEDSETSDYMTLVRRPEDSQTSDYMTLVRRPEDSETSDYMTLDNVYEPLACHRDMPCPSVSSKDEEFQSTENIYQTLDL